MMELYVLDDDGIPVLEPDILKWVTGRNRDVVAKTIIGDVKISTVFLSTNHAFDAGMPLLFETMILGNHYDCYQRRYVTRTGALEGHAEAVALVKKHVLDNG